jgi:hypothetical protein
MPVKLVFNERLRLAAMTFNNLGIVAMSTGVIAPVYEAYVDRHPFEIETSSLVVFELGLCLIAVAHLLLGKLRN